MNEGTVCHFTLDCKKYFMILQGPTVQLSSSCVVQSVSPVNLAAVFQIPEVLILTHQFKPFIHIISKPACFFPWIWLTSIEIDVSMLQLLAALLLCGWDGWPATLVYHHYCETMSCFLGTGCNNLFRNQSPKIPPPPSTHTPHLTQTNCCQLVTQWLDALHPQVLTKATTRYIYIYKYCRYNSCLKRHILS